MTGPELKPNLAPPADFGKDDTAPDPSKWHEAWRRVSTGNGMISLLSVVLALVAGSIMIAFTDSEVQRTAGYFFARPGDMLAAVWSAISGAYVALFQGAIYNFRVDGFAAGIKPFTETLKFATPLIAAGLGVGLAFRAGLFNIGGQGQMLMAAAAAGWVGTSMNLPWPLHMIVAVVAGILAGAIWAGIAGILKARTGAHEVIVTIMLNHIGFYLLAWMLATPGILQAPGSSNPKTAAMAESAILPGILGSQYKLHAGFILALIAVAFTWWLLERSSLGFRFRAVGENPAAAKTAGISVGKMYFLVMLFAGGLVGIAGVSQMLGTVTTGFGGDIDAGIGFDAITVALLGRSSPLGILAAGILFGAFKAGGFAMQASENVPIEIVLVVQSLIVLFIAAPPLVRAIFGLPQPGARRKTKKPKPPKKNAAQIAEEVSA
ncbi:ABC transporter permease [uncultured Microbacterium sp.]|uniref:ABC transporter permease n=1 Tax=uncultured Microbacterium sp. TaxID=191216 RepID=UPI002632707F|nr:ABC transporter permease [uncultured Microbacterium sp.]